METLASVFKALSDDTRLKIMALLIWQGELCVCDVERALGVTQSRSSRHLRYLLNAGLVRNRRHGAWMHYYIPRDLSPERKQLVGTLRRVFAKMDLEDLRGQMDTWLQEKRAQAQTC